MYDTERDDNVGLEAASYAPDAFKKAGKTASEAHKQTKQLIKKQIQKRAQREAQKAEAKAAGEVTKETAKTAAEVGKKAVEAAQKAAQQAADLARKLAEGIVQFIAENPVVLGILLAIIIVLILYHSIKVNTFTFLTSFGESAATGSYTAYEEDIVGVNSDYNKLEKELKKTVDRTEQEYPGYDEYEYQLEEIGHNPNELISYLTVVYENFTRRDMKAVIKELFKEQYTLKYTPRTETRSRTVTVNGKEETEHYTVTILKVTLSNKGLGNVIKSKPLTDVQKARYDVLLQTQGNHPDLFNDIYTDEEVPEDLEVPPEALTDQSFASMIAEGEKYLGRAYVWGGSNPSQGFDCSGFVCWVLNHTGWSVGRTDCNGLKAKCTVVSSDEAKPGDLIFFKGTQKNKAGATHVGIYCGDGIMLHCGNPIQYTAINTNYYKKHFLCYGRMPKN